MIRAPGPEMAFPGGVRGFLAGHFRIVRSLAARRKLEAFRRGHPSISTHRNEGALMTSGAPNTEDGHV